MSKIIHFPGARRPVSVQAGIRADRETFPKASAPDPQNGEIYATGTFRWECVDRVETETFGDFGVVHMADDRDSAGVYRGFETLEEAQVAAARIARERNAVLT